MSLLIVGRDHPAALADASRLANALRQAGTPVLAVVPCHILVREAIRLAPQAVVALDDGQGPALQDALSLLASSQPRPVLLLGPARWPDEPGRWLQDGVMAWLPGALAGVLAGEVAGMAAGELVGELVSIAAGERAAAALADVLAALRLGQARFEHDQAQAAALRDALARLDERKWVDRAKGVLMDHLQLSEQAAFSLLRGASMQANLRVGEVSRSVIEAAQAAEAVNLAGQLRMLSQRCIRALGLRAGLPAAGRGDDGLADSLQQLMAKLKRLAALPVVAPAQAELDAAHLACLALQAQSLAMVGPPQRQGPAADADAVADTDTDADATPPLLVADRLAEALLVAADRLSARLESLGGRQSLRVINLCGRQRMLSQRLAKQALLAGLLPEQAAAAQALAAAETIREFEASLQQLEQAPLASQATRAALVQARSQWQRLLDGLRRAAGPDALAGRSALALESDALLASFEHLTTLYEHSLQVLLH